MNSSPRFAAWLTVPTVLWVFVLVACAAGTMTGSDAQAQDVGVTNDSIKIGIFAPFTGPIPTFGYPLVVGARVVYDEVNEKGGIHGRKVVIVEEDDQCDPTKGVAAVKKLIHEHQVFLLQAGTCSNVALAIKPMVLQAKIPYLASGSTAAAIALPTTPYIFTTTVTSDLEGEALVDFAMSVPNVKRVAVISHRDAWGLAKLEPALKRLRDQYKTEPAANEAMDRGANDSTPQTLRIKAANPDVVIVMLFEKEAAVFLRDAVKYDVSAVFAAPSSLADMAKVIELSGTDAVAKNLYVMRDSQYGLHDPQMAAVATQIKTRYPNVVLSTTFPTLHSSASVVVEALRRAGRNLTRERFLKELEGLQGFEDGGLMPGTVSFSPENHRGRRVGQFVAYKDGNFVTIGTKYVPIR